MTMQRKVTIEMDHDQALVLFELLSTEIDDNNATSICKVFSEDAELWALNNLVRDLEARLAAPFADDYNRQVDLAKASLVKRFGN